MCVSMHSEAHDSVQCNACACDACACDACANMQCADVHMHVRVMQCV